MTLSSPPKTASCRLVAMAPALTVWCLAAASPDAAADFELPLTAAVSVAADQPEVPQGVRRMAVSFGRAVVEGLNGRRTAAQFSDRVSQRVIRRILLRAAADRGGPAFVPASLRVQLVSPSAAEVTMRLERSGRSVPAAFRLDRRRDGWRCSSLLVGPNPD